MYMLSKDANKIPANSKVKFRFDYDHLINLKWLLILTKSYN